MFRTNLVTDKLTERHEGDYEICFFSEMLSELLDVTPRSIFLKIMRNG